MENQVNLRELSRCTVLDPRGSTLPFSSLWSDRTAVLIFLRHFGCEACREHATQVWQKKEAFESKGARIHFIGNGGPQFIEKFKSDFGLTEASIYTDPSLKVFRAAGFRRGFWVCPGEISDKVRFIARGTALKIKNPDIGDIWQLGGVLVIRPDQKVVYQFTSQVVGHFPPRNDEGKIG